MATLIEFKEWFKDFGSRFPAVRDYAAKHNEGGVLLQSWCETLQAFTAKTLADVTRAIVSGKLPPVENVKLGTFADEIRQRCRSVVEWERQARQQESLSASPRRSAWKGQCTSQDMLVHGVACDQLLSELTSQPIDASVKRYRSKHGVRPDIPYDAAIILADEHTDEEHKEAMATLQRHGLTWDAICKRAEKLRAGGVKLFKSVEDL